MHVFIVQQLQYDYFTGIAIIAMSIGKVLRQKIAIVT